MFLLKIKSSKSKIATSQHSKTLSADTKKIHSQLMSCRKNKRFYLKELAKNLKLSLDSILNALDELMQNGYISIPTKKSADFRYTEVYIFDKPVIQ